MSQWMRSYAQPMAPGMGPAMPSYIPTAPPSDHGTPPYAEAAAKGRARMSTLARIAQLFAGAGQGLTGVRPGWGPAANFFGGFGQSYGAASASRRAAEEYAQKQMDAQAEAEHRKRQDALLEAQTKALGAAKPEKQPPEFGPKPWWMALPPDDPTRKAMERKESYVKPEKPEKPAATPKPKVAPEFVQKQVRLINAMDANDPQDYEVLKGILANPPTPEERDAARAKLMSKMQISPGYYRMTPP